MINRLVPDNPSQAESDPDVRLKLVPSWVPSGHLASAHNPHSDLQTSPAAVKVPLKASCSLQASFCCSRSTFLAFRCCWSSHPWSRLVCSSFLHTFASTQCGAQSGQAVARAGVRLHGRFGPSAGPAMSLGRPQHARLEAIPAVQAHHDGELPHPLSADNYCSTHAKLDLV